jgi:hypothetical protein
MPPSKLLLSAAAIAIAALPSTLPTPALADTFQIFNRGGANAHTVFGIDTAGAVVIQSATGPGQALLYQTCFDGVIINSGLGQTRCNNGHEVYFAMFATPASPNPDHSGIFTGANLTDLLTNPSVSGSTLDQVELNNSGDFAWVDARDETIFEAKDQTPKSLPEPGTLLLLATGSLTLIAIKPRRLN